MPLELPQMLPKKLLQEKLQPIFILLPPHDKRFNFYFISPPFFWNEFKNKKASDEHVNPWRLFEPKIGVGLECEMEIGVNWKWAFGI